MPFIDRLYRKPPIVTGASMASSWLGLLTSWAALGFGATAAVSAIGLLASGDGVCATSAEVCQVSGWGGLVLGLVALLAAPALWIFVARGFGPPATWWVVPLALVAAALAPFAAPGAQVRPGQLVVSGAFLIAAVFTAIGTLRQARWALFGWVRLDGLDAREVPHRLVDRVVLAAALAAAAGGAAFGAFSIATLASG